MHLSPWIRGTVVAALLTGAPAPAQSATSGFELERLEFNSGRGALLSGNGEVLVPGALNVGLLGHYAHLPLVLQNGEAQLDRVRHRASSVLAASYGLLPWLEVGAQVPVVLWQQGGDPSRLGLPALSPQGLGTPVLQARLGVLSRRREHPVDLAVDLGAGLPVGSSAALARDPGLRFRARATVGMRWADYEPTLDAGVLVRPANALAGRSAAGLVPELRLGAGVARSFPRLRAELALRAAFATDTRQPSFELLGGARLPLTPALELFALAGPGLGAAPGTPTARVMVGLNFHAQPPPGLERLTEAIPQFYLEQETVGDPVSAPRYAATPVPTRELVPAEPLSLASSAPPLHQGAVLFEPGRAELTADRHVLEEVVQLLRSLPGDSVIILEGHAGQEGREQEDRLLAFKRAQAVRHFLAEQGVPASNLRVRAPSAHAPPPPEGPERARRVEVFVSSESSAFARDTP